MRKFIFISTAVATLFSTLLVSCNNEESYTPCRIEITADGGGRVQFEGYPGRVQYYNPRNEAVVIAHPDDGYSFEGWYANQQDTPVCTEKRYVFTVEESMSLTARFVYKTYSIRISSTSGGSVCFENETETSLTLPCSREITAVAKADEGYTFIGWYKKDSTLPVSPQPSYIFKASEDIELIAKFNKQKFVDGYEYIDLELPSGTLWATCNVEAANPEEYGGYYAWGETEEKSEYSWETYKWCNGSNNTITKYCTDNIYGTVDSKTLLDPNDDVARTMWGGNWRVPTANELQELFDNCIWSYGKLNGTDGYWVTSRNNGKSIFLPTAGCRQGIDIRYSGVLGFYWSATSCNGSSSAYNIRFYNIHTGIDEYERTNGFTIRPVCN